MLRKFYLIPTLLLTTFQLHAQFGKPGNGIQISTEETVVTDSSTTTTDFVSGSPYDTAIFDSTARITFKIHENRGDEMIHNWISLGCPKAPHVYLGAGIYHFDKSGLSDVQIGWYPLVYPNYWESYFAFERMFFLKKKTKEVKTALCIEEDFQHGLRVHYNYLAPLIRVKYYGITSGVAFEGWLNPKKEVAYIYRDLQHVNGEDHSVLLYEYKQMNIHIGLSRMRCRNVEYEAPMKYRKKKVCRGSTMSRLTIGGMYFPVNICEMKIDSGYVVDYMLRATQKPFAFYFAWEGRLAFQNMKREWGLHMNLMFVTPSWNRMTDYKFAITNSWGVYVSLDQQDPKWKRKMCANGNF